MLRRSVLLFVLVTVPLAGCGEGPVPPGGGGPAAGAPTTSSTATTAAGSRDASPDPAASPARHAIAGVVPGSHEDWCGEHAVPESACTRCDPGLIPAFKATRDWCPEHGLPESHCLVCNPDLNIERPPGPAGM